MRYVLFLLACMMTSACGRAGGDGGGAVTTDYEPWWENSCSGGGYGRPGCSTGEPPFGWDGQTFKLEVRNRTPCVWTQGTAIPWSHPQPQPLDLSDPLLPGGSFDVDMPEPGTYDIHFTGYHSVTYEPEVYSTQWHGGLLVIQ